VKFRRGTFSRRYPKPLSENVGIEAQESPLSYRKGHSNRIRLLDQLSGFLQVGEVPAGGGVFGVAGDDAQLSQTVEAVLDGFLFAAGVFELGFDLGDGPFAALGTHEVADSGELVFEGTGEGLLLEGGDDGFFRIGVLSIN